MVECSIALSVMIVYNPWIFPQPFPSPSNPHPLQPDTYVFDFSSHPDWKERRFPLRAHPVFLGLLDFFAPPRPPLLPPREKLWWVFPPLRALRTIIRVNGMTHRRAFQKGVLLRSRILKPEAVLTTNGVDAIDGVRATDSAFLSSGWLKTWGRFEEDRWLPAKNIN